MGFVELGASSGTPRVRRRILSRGLELWIAVLEDRGRETGLKGIVKSWAQRTQSREWVLEELNGDDAVWGSLQLRGETCRKTEQ